MNIINLNYFTGDHGGSCGYCDNQTSSSSQGFVSNQLSEAVYQTLMDRGWRRCGTYYYKFNLTKVCCLAYTIRANALISEQSRSQRKVAKRFLRLVHNPKILTNLKEALTEKYHKEQKQKQVPDPVLKQEINQSDNQKQQIQTNQNIIPKVVQDEAFQTFANFFQQLDKDNYTSRFEDYLKQKNLIVLWSFDLNLQNVKLFQSQNLKKGEFYSNFVMMIYGLNKKNAFKELPIEKYVPLVRDLFNFQSDNWFYTLEDNGFLSMSHQQKANKVIIEKEPKPVKQLVQKQNIKLINRETFKSNAFSIGNMKVVIKKAEFNQESFALYQKYSRLIHGKQKESKDGYNDFLCMQALKVDMKQSQHQQILFLGCYHMCYYINNQLVAVGVIDMTQNVLSSVYFFYDPDFEDFNFGTFGALIEIEYIQIMNQYFPDFKYYYLGFYIQTTSKMAYKGDYQPAELLCPETYTWVPLSNEMKQEMTARQKLPIKDRKLRISEPHIQVIPDMIPPMDKIQFYKTQVKIIIQKKQYSLNDLQSAALQKLYKYFDEVLCRTGNRLMGEILFEL